MNCTKYLKDVEHDNDCHRISGESWYNVCRTKGVEQPEILLQKFVCENNSGVVPSDFNLCSCDGEWVWCRSVVQ